MPQPVEFIRVTRDERGVALPMALFTLLLMTSLSIAFLTLGQTEPVVSNNHMRGAQARVLAEAGVERAVWALTNGGLAPPGAATLAGSPYDGLTFLTVGTATGGFTVKITGVSSFEVLVETEGWTPSVGRAAVTGYDASDARSKAHRRVQTPVIKLPNFGDTPCALCVKGDLEVKGSASISSTADTSCGNKYGVTTSGTLCLGEACDPSDSQWGNSGSVNGSTDADPDDNQPDDYQRLVAASTFDPFTLTASQLDALRAIARDYGSYYAGDQSFNSSNRIPSGKPIVFIDGNMATSGNPYSGGTFNGWLIVVGSATLAGNGTINGMLYATDDIQSSSGTNTINGVVISQNTTNNSGIDTTTTGNMTINYNCANAKGNNNFAQGWFPKPGGWKEPSG
ncbi:MAG: hypothetical protein HYR51_08550 [Candidatus Rokubacteria bacterium]|nr:hypothetical protein [Candidatus Rokubacteria bacterium]